MLKEDWGPIVNYFPVGWRKQSTYYDTDFTVDGKTIPLPVFEAPIWTKSEEEAKGARSHTLIGSYFMISMVSYSILNNS